MERNILSDKNFEKISERSIIKDSVKRFEVNVDNKSFGTAVFGGKILQKRNLTKTFRARFGNSFFRIYARNFRKILQTFFGYIL